MASSRIRRKRRRQAHAGSKVLLVFGVVGSTTLVVLLGVLGYVLSIASETPDITELKPIDKGSVSEVLAADGSRLGFIQTDTVRTPIGMKEIPKDLRHATIAIEDERFYQHNGVDVEGIARAAVKNVESGKTSQGASTITQQLVRNLYVDDTTKTLNRKIREAKLAQELEKIHPKRWILANYLNTAPYGTVLGRSSVGVEAAAQTYFSKPARKLTLAESAMLAGLPQAPSQYNPFQNPRAAITRRNEVLDKMADLGYIQRSEARTAKRERLHLNKGTKYTQIKEPFFFDYVQQKLIDKYGAGTVRRGGLVVKTTIDPKLQKIGRNAIDSNLYAPSDPSSAIVTIDPATGDIKAMASSGHYNKNEFNLAAQGHRQPGSSFKVMALLTAVHQGANPDSTYYTSKPLSLNPPGFGPWQVKTYDNTYGGRMTLTKATLKSDNSVYAQLALDVGPKKVRQTAYDMGITTHLDGFPAETLGGLKRGVSPLEMANAYATLADGGIRNEPRAIRSVKFPDGHVDRFGRGDRKRTFSDGETSTVTKVLEQNIKQGTATKAQIGCPAAAKTGTTDNFNDAWLVGYTPNLSTAVWVGYPNAQKEMRGVHGLPGVAGGTIPAQIWHDYMSTAKGARCDAFPKAKTPANIGSFSGTYAGSSKDTGLDKSAPQTKGSAPGPATGNRIDNGGTGGTTGGGGAPGSGNQAPGGGNQGYDPNLYAPGAGQKPAR